MLFYGFKKLHIYTHTHIYMAASGAWIKLACLFSSQDKISTVYYQNKLKERTVWNHSPPRPNTLTTAQANNILSVWEQEHNENGNLSLL